MAEEVATFQSHHRSFLKANGAHSGLLFNFIAGNDMLFLQLFDDTLLLLAKEFVAHQLVIKVIMQYDLGMKCRVLRLCYQSRIEAALEIRKPFGG